MTPAEYKKNLIQDFICIGQVAAPFALSGNGQQNVGLLQSNPGYRC